MGTLTTYGYKKPANGDLNWWDQLDYNITRGDTHSHNGVDSPVLTTAAINKGSQIISNAGWTLISNGNYSQNVTLPAGYLYSTGFVAKFYVNGGAEDGAEVLLTTEKLSDTTYKIYTNDNTLALKVVYA